MTISPAEKFNILSVETRLKIIELLKTKGAIGAKSIAEQIDITTAAVSQHLKILKQAGLVNCQRKGYHIPYTINEEALEDCRKILSKVCSCNDSTSINDLTDDDLEQASMGCLMEYQEKLENILSKVKKKLINIKEKDDFEPTKSYEI